MEFTSHKTIYLQISDYVCEKALTNEWKAGERIPSVRELGVLLEVNPNTVMRAFEYLESKGIIYNKRGIGFFLACNAAEKVQNLHKAQFIEEDLPALFKKIYLLQIPFDELAKEYKAYCKAHFSNH
ncbi:MAG: GntR family transcriptional regulator [Cytophagaceae bacterium]|jgi:DNA-binding transcriptional regulator YhcF (GntR family)|nr:GntR family transcriptional regulator [Cytophagaceae bacterium]